MKTSAGIICYREENGIDEIFMCHSTGINGVWSFPKGLMEESEDRFEAASREFKEETNFDLPKNAIAYYLGEVQVRKDKMVCAFAVCNPDVDPSKCFSNEIEFPVGTGIIIPEVDDYKWVTLEEAYKIINPKQIPLLDNFKLIREYI